MECLNENDAVEFVHGLLPEGDARRVEAHIDTCSICLTVVTEVARASAPPLPNAHDGILEPVRSGTRVGRYLIERMIGAGAMGFVYAARDEELDRKVAIKVVRAEWSGSARYRARLLREARAIAQVTHPHVVSVHDVGTLGDDVFIAMELVDGGSLRSWLDESARSWREILTVLARAARGLAAAHAANIVHRDFKPENVLVGRDGRVVVADFGLARSLTDPAQEESTFLGTPAYMAPEQRAGAPADARSDQYAFSVVLHEALFGARPSPSPVDMSGVPAWLRRILLRGLSTKPSERFPSMDALVAAIERDRTAGRNAVAGAALLALAAIGAVAYRHQRAEEHACDDAARAVSDVWSVERATKAHDSFGRSGLSYAETTWQSAARTIDAYAKNWSSLRAQVCTERLRGGAADPLGRQEACLSDRLKELDRSTSLLVDADQKTVQNALPLVEGLSPVAHCANARALSSPPDPARAARVKALKDDVARVNALNSAGRPREARPIAEAAAGAADETDYRPLQAEAYLALGNVRGRDGDARGAETAFLRGATLADAAADDRTRALAWIGILYQVGYEQRRFDAVDLYDHEAVAAIERLGGDPLLDARRRSTLGLVLKAQGDVDRAREELEAAVVEKRAHLPPGSDELATTLVNLGTSLREEGRFPQAIDAFTEARDVYTSTRGAEAPFVALTQNDIGDALTREGKPAEGLVEIERAVALAERQLAPDHPHRGIYAATRAEALCGLGRYEDARRDAERAARLFEKRFGADTPRLVPVLTTLGKALLGLGNTTDALSTLERSYALSRGPTDLADRADADFALARALGASHRDPARALSLATEAERVYGVSGDAIAREAVRAWLATSH